jgi:hypothetical protein
VRSLVEAWLDRYPPAEAPRLAARLRSPRDDQHRSAFFELLLYRLLESLGHRVLAVEPKLPHTWKSPDFLVERFYLEAITAQGEDLHAALKRKANRYGALDLPLVVAVNSSRDEAGLRGATQQLWHGPRGPQRRTLSAVLAFDRADPWIFGESPIRLIRNPWAERPLPPLALGDGCRVGELLQL